MSGRATGSRCGQAAAARSWWTAVRHPPRCGAVWTGWGSGRVPLLIITHFHADHVAGLTGVLQRRRIGQLWVSPLAPPGPLTAMVSHQAAQQGIPVNAPLPGTRASVGEAELQVLGPVDHVAVDQDESSKQNDSSLVIMVEVRRPTAAAHRRRRTAWPAGDSGHRGATFEPMSSRFRTTVRPSRIRRSSPPRRPASPSRVPGVDNDYGHPAPRTRATRPVGWNDPAPDRSATARSRSGWIASDWLRSPNDDHALPRHEH